MSIIQTCHVIWRFPKIGLPIVPPNHPAIMFGNLFPNIIINHPAIKGYHHFRQPNKNWLVVSTCSNPSEKYKTSSVGSIITLTEWKVMSSSHVPVTTNQKSSPRDISPCPVGPRLPAQWNLWGPHLGGPSWESPLFRRSPWWEGPLFEWPLE